MYGDPRFEFVASGSNATNSSGIEGFYGAYSGLSLINNEDVINLQISASVNEFFVGPSGAGSVGQGTGYKIYPGLSTIDFPPMRSGTASLMRVNRIQGNAASAFNTSYNWVVWRRVNT